MQTAYLVRTCHDLRKFALLLVLALDNGLDDGGMVGAQVDEDVPDASLPKGLEEGERCCVSSRLSVKGSTSTRVYATHTILAVSSFHGCCVSWCSSWKPAIASLEPYTSARHEQLLKLAILSHALRAAPP
jgi:hypothetical protein